MKWHDKNLMQILDDTEESHHLNELLMLRSKNKKDASADDILNNIVHPTLEDLEYYLKYYAKEETGKDELKRMISAWIDAQIKKN
ncbi:MAG: hypothetical protein JXQ82_07490 [Methanomicrobiaceae archaeon]|nr:hypothetical protein [Methanomicrobiaceae archaeon]